MRGFSLLFLGAAFSLMCGCRTTVVREEPRNVALGGALLWNVRGSEVQMVERAWKDEPFVAECVLKGDGEKFTAVLLAPHMRLATLTIERPHTLRWERAPQVPSALDPEYIIFDMALALLPTDVLSRSIGNGFRVTGTADGKRRQVVDAGDGELHSIRQVLPDGSIYFRNARYSYEVTVKTVSHED